MEKIKSKLLLSLVITFFFMTFFISSVSALSARISPSSFTYNLSINEFGCGLVHITSDSFTLSVFDNWAENKYVNWSSKFNTPASVHNLTLTYPKNLSSNQNEVEVCVKGSTPGEYHGIIIFRLEQQGNQILQLGIWLKVTINGSLNPPIPPEDNRWVYALLIIGLLVLFLLAIVIYKINE